MSRVRGFTLLELLIAMTILAVLAAVVYATLSSILNATDSARAETMELRLREFLVDSITTNLSTLYVDPFYQQEVFQFVGKDEEGPHGPADALRFCSTAPLAGAPAMPGDIKEVRYEVLSETPEDSGLDLAVTEEEAERGVVPEGTEAYRMLQAMETPLLGANVQQVDADAGYFVPDESYKSPSWTLPIRSMNIRYFDGTDWVDDWDSMELRRIPWCVEIKINFARTQAQLEADASQQYDPEEDPDLTLVVPIPVAHGTDENTLLAEEQRMQEEWLRRQGGLDRDGSGRPDGVGSGGFGGNQVGGVFGGRPGGGRRR